MSSDQILAVLQAVSPDGSQGTIRAPTMMRPSPGQLVLRPTSSLAGLSASTKHTRATAGPVTTAILAREANFAVHDFSSHNHGTISNTVNTYNAPVTTIQKADTVTIASNDDLVLLETLPAHPDITSGWQEDPKQGRNEDILSWADDATGEDLVLWIYAPAGTGKTSLAYDLKLNLRSRNRLAASIFLAHIPSSWGPESIIRLLGGEIGRTHRGAIPIVAEAVRQCHGASLSSQVKSLICDPILSLQLPHPLIILLDAFDDWAPHSHFIKLLAQLTPYTAKIRFIVLGKQRPNDRACDQIQIKPYALSPVPVEVMQEYIERQFGTLHWGPTSQPSRQDIQRLAEMVGGVFTRVETVVEAIRKFQRRLSGCADFSAMMNILGFPDYSQHEKGTIECMDYSILFFKAAVALRPLGDPHRAASLHNLATALYSRFHASGVVQDLHDAIAWHKEGLELRPTGHPDRAPCLHNLALALRALSDATVDIPSLDEAVSMHREAVEECPVGHPNRSVFLYHFTLCLYWRFQKLGVDGDLDEAIAFGREALALRPGTHPQRSHSLWNIQRQLYHRYTLRGGRGDLREAISIAQEGLELLPSDSPDYGVFFQSLSTYQGELFRLSLGSSSIT